MEYIFLIIGLIFLVKGADYFVDGASKVAAYFSIPPILIGLTIVALGTSAPEAAVSISAALKGSGDISIGNIVGSNIFNIIFILGITSLIKPLPVSIQSIRKDIPFALLASLVLLIQISDIRLGSMTKNLVSRADGMILILFFVIFMYYIFETARREKDKVDKSLININKLSLSDIIFTVIGLVGVILGGNIVVENSVKIAYAWGMSETLVGLTIVSIGTSLPELITSVTAASKGESDIAVGNVVGSNIFNIFFVLGISSIITPIVVDPKIFIDAVIGVMTTLLLLFFAKTKKKVGRSEGVVFLILYISYMIFVIGRK